MGCVSGEEEVAAIGGSAVERVNDQALVGGMLERRRRSIRWNPLGCGREVELGMRNRVELRRAARPGKRKREKKTQD